MLSLRRLAAVAFTAYAAVAHAALVPTSYTLSGKPIYEAPPDSRVVQDDAGMLVFAPNGTLLHALASTGPDRPRQTQPEVDVNVDQIYATLGPTDTLLSFNTSFIVPPMPTAFHSQYMVFCQGITTLDESGAPEHFYGGGILYGRHTPYKEPGYRAVLVLENFAQGSMVVLLSGVTAGETMGLSVSYQRGETNDIAEPSYRYYFNLPADGLSAAQNLALRRIRASPHKTVNSSKSQQTRTGV